VLAGIRDAFVDVARTTGGLEEDEAVRIVQDLLDDGGFKTDCWPVKNSGRKAALRHERPPVKAHHHAVW
jgi:hypothetical protein